MHLLMEDKGEYIGLREARKHLGWYITGIRGRQRCATVSTARSARMRYVHCLTSLRSALRNTRIRATPNSAL